MRQLKIYYVLLLVMVTVSGNSFSQGRIVFNGGYLVIDNGARVVLDNGNANAISTTGSGGNVISEDEDDKIIWNIGTNTGVYTIPYTTTPAIQGGNDTKIPFIMNIIASGTGSGHIEFSTYETSTDVNTVFPSMVTMLPSPLLVVDRFWIIDAENFTANPTSTLTFYYDDAANEIAVTNTITEAALQAERFNSTLNDWESLYFGTADPLNNYVSGVNVPPIGLYEAWTLTNLSIALPVTGLDFQVKEKDRQGLVYWSTQIEINTSHYELYHSTDAIDWELLTKKDAAGNTQELTEYNYIHENPENGLNYYQLIQLDQNGEFEFSEIRVLMLDESNINVYPNPVTNILHVQVPYDNYTIELIDGTGRLVESGENLRYFDFSDLAPSIYMVRIVSSTGETEQRRIVKTTL